MDASKVIVTHAVGPSLLNKEAPWVVRVRSNDDDEGWTTFSLWQTKDEALECARRYVKHLGSEDDSE